MITMEKPIIFSKPMVQAILDGIKTQTRRVIDLHPPYTYVEENWATGEYYKAFSMDEYGDYHNLPCPKGNVGDILWVKETYRTDARYDHMKPTDIPHNAPIEYFTDIQFHIGKIRPSIFMCRWMSRITLEITGVRVERVQDITEDDTTAEGMWKDPCDQYAPTNKAQFMTLWDEINGKKHPWESNPYVWVINFKVVN
jgi:hypothetical protein